ncbi:hypothetical protein Tco_0354944 [Tanacetum coccineum]
MKSIEQCIVERASHEHKLQNGLKRLNERQLQIQECTVQNASDASSGDNECSRIVSDNGNVQDLESQSNTSGDESSRSRNESNDKSTSGDDTDSSPTYDTELMVEQSESISNTCVVETGDKYDDERVALANLIANLKLNVEDNKKIQKQLKKANASLTQELSECKSVLAETSRTLGESNSIWDSCLVALQNKQTEFERYKAYNDRTVDYDKLKRKLNKTLGLLAQKDIDIKKIPHDQSDPANRLIPDRGEILTLEEESRSKLNKDLVKPFDYTKLNIDELESDKAEFSNMYGMLLQEYVSNDVMCSYLHSLSDLDALTELQCLYVYKVKECECLAQNLSKQTEFVSKEGYNELLKSFAKLEKHSISLELALQQCQEQMKNDTICKEKASNVFKKEREQYFEIQDLKAHLQDKNIAISELKKLIKKMKVVRQPTAYKFERSQLLRHRFASQVGVSHDLTKPVTPHSWPQVRKSSFAKPYDVNAHGPSKKSLKHVSFQSPREYVGSNDMVHNHYLKEAKKKAQLQKDKALNTKPSV